MVKYKIIDISRPISEREPVYPGNPKVSINRIKEFRTDGHRLSEICLGVHSASHVDAPSHLLETGKAIDKISLESCLGWCRVMDFTKQKINVDERDLKRFKFKEDEIIILKTRNSISNSKKFNPKFVYLTQEGARYLIKNKIKAVGIDAPSIKKFHLRPDLVHPCLLKAGVLIYEGLNLKQVKAGKYFFIGLPLKITGVEASPVRAVLIK